MTPVDALRTINLMNPEDSLIDIICEDPSCACEFADLMNNNVSEKVIDAISKDGNQSFTYATLICKGVNVPQKIIDAMTNDKESSQICYEYFTFFKGKNIPLAITDKVRV